MLCQNSTEILRIDEVGRAYDIAWGFLEGTGAIKYPVTAHEVILSSIVAGFEQGQRNKLILANKAISAYQRRA